MEFLQTHCIDCHGEKKQKGDRRFDSLTLDFHDLDTAWAWEEILAIFPGSTMSATIPDGSTTNYFPATDERGLMVRTESRLAAWSVLARRMRMECIICDDDNPLRPIFN
jgi:hypothetical protein